MTDLPLTHLAGGDLATPPAPPPAPADSTLDRIRAMYRTVAKPQFLDLPFPRNPVMGIRYRVIHPNELVTDRPRTDAELNQDTLITACEAILIREGSDWDPLTHDGEPVRFDETLAELLGAPSLEHGGTARQVLLKAFSTAPLPELAIARQVLTLSDWMAGEVGAIDEDREEQLLGES